MRAAAALALLALAAAAPAPPRSPEDAQRYRDCLRAARDKPAAAVELGGRWRVEGGGLPAQHCLALGLIGEGKPAAAQAELERAARAADAAADPLAPELWGQAGNAALLAGKPAEARAHLTAALARGAAAPPAARGAWLVDRARAAAAAADAAPARADLDAALKLAPGDPVAWTLSAALARRQGDLARARRDILAAERLAPADPDVRRELAAAKAAYFDGPAARAAEPVAMNPPPY